MEGHRTTNQQRPNELDIWSTEAKKQAQKMEGFDYGLHSLKSRGRNKASPSMRSNLVRPTAANAINLGQSKECADGWGAAYRPD